MQCKKLVAGLVALHLLGLTGADAAQSAFPNPPPADQAIQLHHVTLFVSDHVAVSDWYVKHLGFEVIDRAILARSSGANFDSVRVGIGGLWINISRLPNPAQRDPVLTYNGWRQIALAVKDVLAMRARLQAAGVNVKGDGALEFETRRPDGRVTRFRADPEGNVMELYEDL